MPSKNVYVAQEDAELFEQAAAFAGGLSPAVAHGLRLFVQDQQRRAGGFTMVEVEVDQDGTTCVKRFHARRVLKHRATSPDQLVVTEVFHTARGQFALYVRTVPTWTFSGPHVDDGAFPGWQGGDLQVVERTLEVFTTREELMGQLSSQARQAYEVASHSGTGEDLDI